MGLRKEKELIREALNDLEWELEVACRDFIKESDTSRDCTYSSRKESELSVYLERRKRAKEYGIDTSDKDLKVLMELDSTNYEGIFTKQRDIVEGLYHLRKEYSDEEIRRMGNEIREYRGEE